MSEAFTLPPCRKSRKPSAKATPLADLHPRRYKLADRAMHSYACFAFACLATGLTVQLCGGHALPPSPASAEMPRPPALAPQPPPMPPAMPPAVPPAMPPAVPPAMPPANAPAASPPPQPLPAAVGTEAPEEAAARLLYRFFLTSTR